MTGRRILDAAAIFKAVRGVASKHVAFRSHQLDVYSKTSTLAKAVQSQTERVTLTVKAASVLAGRFNEQASSTPASQPEPDSKASSVPSDVKLGREGKVQAERPDEVKFYGNSEEKPATKPLITDDLQNDQDGGKRPSPSIGSETPSKNVNELVENEGEAPSDTSEVVLESPKGGEQEPASAALPSSKVSDEAEDAHVTHELSAGDQTGNIVQDIPNSQIQEQAISKGQAIPEEDPLSSEAYSEIFRSPRIARMLGGQHSEDVTRGRSSQQEAKNTPSTESNSAQGSDSVLSDAQSPALATHEAANPSTESPKTTAAHNRSEEDVHALAADMAIDADKVRSESLDVGSKIGAI